MANRQYPETVLMHQFFNWLFYQYRYLYNASFHIPNEGKRSRYVANLMHLKAGIPDILIAYPIRNHAGLFIELKIKPNKPSKHQIEMMKIFEDNGYKCAVCYSLDECMTVVNNYLGAEDDRQCAVS